jgi:hypothetical protein
MNPYIQQMQQAQDLGGLSPVFQNIAQQQANQNMAMQEGMNLTNQAGQTQQSGGMNPLAMAMMLRKGKTPDQADINAKDAQMGGLSTYNPFTQFSVAKEYGTNPFSESSRMIAAQNAGLR